MSAKAEKSESAFRTISEVSETMGVPQHVLRFWETKFSQISPMKRGGGRRYYRPEDVEIIEVIRDLLHEDGYTIKGAQKHLREQGVKNVIQAFHAKAENENTQTKIEPEIDYNSQILTMAQKGEQKFREDEDTLATLKSLRARLIKVRQHLKPV
ncbi:MerR family transcriptional regulator [Paremcibacter congregatus]|uniref:MerR family transcriptional regulator n=1 Tax=Paremcibacter congregatus TaxID=2043170 RepID=UPI0030EEDB52